MNDGEAMFLRKLAFAVGRLDFWNLTKELTPFQMAIHRAAWAIEPMGEDRADLREAVNTMANSPVKLTKDQVHNHLKVLTEYLPVHNRPEEVMTPEQAAKLGTMEFAKANP